MVWAESGEEDVATYLVQIVNKPHQIIALKVRRTLLILFPIKYVTELILEPRYGSVETMKSLQGWKGGRGHEKQLQLRWQVPGEFASLEGICTTAVRIAHYVNTQARRCDTTLT